jgi:hypothetical protein
MIVHATLMVADAADSAEHPAWHEPVRTSVRREANGWTRVGLERMRDASANRNG